MSRSRPSHLAAGFVALACVVAACTSEGTSTAPSAASAAATTSGPQGTSAPEPTAAPTTDAPQTTAVVTTSTVEAVDSTASGPRLLAPFATYTDVPLLDDSTPYAGPSTPASLDGVDLTEGMRSVVAADPDLVAAIEANGFAVRGGWGSRFFHGVFESAAYDYGTMYVTTDALYNAWHLVFAKALRDTERDVLAPVLRELLAGAVDSAREQADELAGSALADHADRVVSMYEAAATLLGVDVGTISDRAADEVALASDAAEVTASPITAFGECRYPESFQGCVDYTLFRPRGHYTSSPELEQWFRAMSELGQQAFYLGDADGLRVGLLASRIITSDPGLLDLWQQIYEPTSFLVGVADDYTPIEAIAALSILRPEAIADPTVLTDDTAVSAVASQLALSRTVGIDPENTSVRVMGARLVLDSYVLDQLLWPNVGTEDNRRVHTSALDLASVFGSTLATELQTESGQPDYPHYGEQLAAMRDLVAGRSGDAWAGTVYDAWLHALEPQFADRTAAYPDYMQTAAWAAKSLQTGFGSYTELKHDTLLYAKQSSAGEGEGPPVPPYEPQHWVEPDPVTFGRLAALARLMRDGLEARGLLADPTAELLDGYVELTEWLAGIAAAELAGQVAASDDNTRLGTIGSELELLWYLASDISRDPSLIPDSSEDASLISDIARSSFEILHLGVGEPDPLYVIVPDGHGGFQLATGAVYSYYEFWRSAELPRLTDEEWRALVQSFSTPPRPAWLDGIVLGVDVADTAMVVQET